MEYADAQQKQGERRITTHLMNKFTEIVNERTQVPEIKAAYDEFCARNRRARGNAVKWLTIGQIDELLQILKVPYGEFMERINVTEYPVAWPTEEAAKMAELLDKITDDKKKWFADLFEELLPDRIREALEQARTEEIDCLRITALLNVTLERHPSRSLFDELGIQNRWSGKMKKHYIYNAYPHEYYPAIAVKAHISLHWLLGVDGPVLAKSALTEDAMDKFVLLPKSYQEAILIGLQSAIMSGGVSIG